MQEKNFRSERRSKRRKTITFLKADAEIERFNFAHIVERKRVSCD